MPPILPFLHPSQLRLETHITSPGLSFTYRHSFADICTSKKYCPKIVIGIKADQQTSSKGNWAPCPNSLATRSAGGEAIAQASAPTMMEIFFQISNDLFCVVGADRYFQQVNPAWERVLGWSTVEILSKPWIELVHPEDVEASLEAEAVASEVPSWELENRYRHKDGSYRWLSWKVLPSEDGCSYAIAKDITEQKALATQLCLLQSCTASINEERLRTVLENMPVMLNALDERGNIIVWNRECERITGYLSENIVENAQAWKLLYPNLEYRELMLNLAQKKGNDYRNWEWEITCADGSQKTISWSNISEKFPIPGWKAWSIGVDVTAGKRAKAELLKDNEELETKIAKRTAQLWDAHQRVEQELVERRRTEAELKRHVQMIDLVNDTITIRQLDDAIAYWNQGAEKLYSWTKEEAIGKPIHELLKTKFPDNIAEINQELHAQGSWQGELIHTKKNGTEITVASRWTLWQDRDSKPSMIVEINRDITEKKQAEAEIQKLNEDLKLRNLELKATNQELEAFCYSVSHDLRAPLRTIDSFGAALEEDYNQVLGAEGNDYLRRVRMASGRMKQLIDDLLCLSRIARSEIELAKVDLSAIAQSISTELQDEQPHRPVEFHIAPGIKVQGDAKLLRVALENLLGNAWKYTGKHPTARIEFGILETGREGKSQTRAQEEDLATQNSTLEAQNLLSVPKIYYVRDDGAGFDMTYAKKLFAPFQRLHSMTEFEGNGIGLATVQRIIHRHGGQIWAKGEVEGGATFYFTL